MIVKMKKVTVLVSARDREAALERLRNLGVVHVHAVKPPSSESIHAIEAEVSDVDRALQVLGAHDQEIKSDASAKGAQEAVKTLLSLAQQRDECLRELSEHRENNRWFEQWGAVSLSSVQALREAGIFVRFYVADKKALQTLPSDEIIEVVGEEEQGVCLAHVSRDSGARLDFRESHMPQVEVGPMRARMAELNRQIEDISHEIRDLARRRDGLSAYRGELAQQLEFNLVKHGMGETGRIAYLQGFCPASDVDAIARASSQAGWGYAVEDADDPDITPTLIHTPKWVRIINPVFSFMGTVPGYREFDISLWFLIFFSLFYAMLVGDGGYGILFLIFTVLARLKFKKAPPEPFVLMYVLSAGTMIWGAISGTWFGMDISGMPFLNQMVLEKLSSAGGDQNFMMYLCFLIGAIHLSIAHTLIAIREINSPKALAQVGWIAIVWSLFFLAGHLVVNEPFPHEQWYWLLIAGFVLVLLFANFQKNIVKGALSTLTNLPLSVISSFSDVVSYLRLFAVGFATYIVASSFNGIAEGVAGGIVGGLVAAIILFLGHGINMILAMMAVVVHGIRLNMLEFSGHMGMQWSGKPYRPFKM